MSANNTMTHGQWTSVDKQIAQQLTCNCVKLSSDFALILPFCFIVCGECGKLTSYVGNDEFVCEVCAVCDEVGFTRFNSLINVLHTLHNTSLFVVLLFASPSLLILSLSGWDCLLLKLLVGEGFNILLVVMFCTLPLLLIS